MCGQRPTTLRGRDRAAIDGATAPFYGHEVGGAPDSRAKSVA
jgi:hypothetical protein